MRIKALVLISCLMAILLTACSILLEEPAPRPTTPLPALLNDGSDPFAIATLDPGFAATVVASSQKMQNLPTLVIETYRDEAERILIPAGDFKMGCDSANPQEACQPNELPLHSVYLDAYQVHKYEVTNAQYAQCVGRGACSAPATLTSYTRPAYYGEPAFDDYPVIYVDWYQASAYCAATGGALPSEAQWEKAARGSQDTRMFPWGDARPTCGLVNGYVDNIYCVTDTAPGSSRAEGFSPYGVMNMSGNVWEWTNDWLDEGYYAVSPQQNPTGPLNGTHKVVRGGGWDRPWEQLRVDYRHRDVPGSSYSSVGFRCVYPVEY